MYETFYKFKEKPFSLLPDPAFLYLGKQHSNAFATLEYGIMDQLGITVITGEIGSGKTSLVRHLLNKIETTFTVGLIANTHQTLGDILPWVALAFGLPYKDKTKVELYDNFVQFLIKEYARGKRTVLIVDEAQNMDLDTLEELRMLSNINSDKDQVLQLILLGQPELRDMLRQPKLQQFAQRIAANFHLEALSAEETYHYIQHRLRVAGGNAALFETAACEMIHEHTRGIPRLINMLCDMALVYGYSEKQQTINARLVSEVISDKADGGLFPSEARDKQGLEEFWPRDPQLAKNLNNIANVYRSQGKFEEAEANYKRAVAILENSVGAEHPNLATVLNNLAVLYRKQSKYKEAESLYQRVLTIVEKALGPKHRNVYISLNNLAVLYQKQGKYMEAEPLMKRALAILEKTLGPDHPDIAANLKNFARLQRYLGRDKEAAESEERAAAIEKNETIEIYPNPTARLQPSPSKPATSSGSVESSNEPGSVPGPAKKY